MSEVHANRWDAARPPSPAAHRHGGAVVVHLFRRTGAGYCISNDRSGRNIPRGLNGETWTYARDMLLTPGDGRVIFDTTVALAELEQAGYFLIGGWYEPQ